jgi:putative ABC transport system permease protein
MNVITLTPLDLTIAALLVLALAGLAIFLHLELGRRILIAAVRTTVQLLLIGFVLKVLFENVHLTWITAMAFVMLLAAGYEVMARQRYRFTGWWGYGIGTTSMFISSFAVTLVALIVIVAPDPWYKPQYAIPLLGMLLGNTMNGIALSIDHLTHTTHQQRNVIEGRLMLGQSWQEAISDIQRDSMRVGMIPIINAMAAAGIISLPGMMTGQILSGTPPLEAVKYQILIMFLIASGTGMGTITANRIAAHRLFDHRHRLRSDRLRQLR